MQKLINVLALASFGINVALVGAGYYAYSQREKIIQSATDKAAELAEKKLKDVVTKAATEGAVNAVKPMLNGMVKNAIPKLPVNQAPVMKNIMSGPAINF